MENAELSRAILLHAVTIGVESGQLDYPAKNINAAIKLAKAAPEMVEAIKQCLWLIECRQAIANGEWKARGLGEKERAQC